MASRTNLLLAGIIAIAILFSVMHLSKADYTDWKSYGGNANNNKYSDLTQVDTSNVNQLQDELSSSTNNRIIIKNHSTFFRTGQYAIYAMGQ